MDFLKADRRTILEHIQKQTERNESAEKFYENERSGINKDMILMNSELNTGDISKLIQLQSEHLNMSQKLNDMVSSYLATLSREKSKLKRSKGDRLEYYIHGFGIKVSNTQMVELLDRDLSENSRSVQLLEIHIDFLRNTYTDCKNIGYSIKNRISLMSYM